MKDASDAGFGVMTRRSLKQVVNDGVLAVGAEMKMYDERVMCITGSQSEQEKLWSFV